VPKKVTSPSTVTRRQVPLYQEETTSGDDDNIVCTRSGSPEAGCFRERESSTSESLCKWVSYYQKTCTMVGVQ